MAYMRRNLLIVSLIIVRRLNVRYESLVELTKIADQVTNLREDILINRLKYSLTSMDEAQGEKYLKKAGKALEK